MNLQNQVLHLYKENYPKATFQSISDHTGIQITRVFRLFNGSEMKVSEYETFHKILEKEKYNNELVKLSHECLEKLSSARNAFIIAQLKQALKIQALKASFNHHTLPANSIAN